MKDRIFDLFETDCVWVCQTQSHIGHICIRIPAFTSPEIILLHVFSLVKIITKEKIIELTAIFHYNHILRTIYTGMTYGYLKWKRYSNCWNGWLWYFWPDSSVISGNIWAGYWSPDSGVKTKRIPLFHRQKKTVIIKLKKNDWNRFKKSRKKSQKIINS